jgi:hypothetical protein
MGYRNYGPSNGFIVDANGSDGDFTTIQAAVTAAPANTTIFIKPSTYTENITLASGKNLAAWTCDAFTPNVTISGTITVTSATTVSISGIRLQTNSAAFLAVTGSAASIVNLQNCYLNCTNNTGITYSSSSASSAINLSNCQGDLGTTGIGLYTKTSPGGINFFNSIITNSGNSATASSNSAGLVAVYSSLMVIPFSTSSSGAILFFNATVNTLPTNTASLITAGTGFSSFDNCYIASGTAACISIGAGTTVAVRNCTISSSNGTSAITGAGTLTYAGIVIGSTQVKFDTTTQVGGLLPGGVFQAPSAGYLGQRIESTATAIATSNGVSKTITSIALTPGIWDVSALSFSSATGGTQAISQHLCNISITDNTLTGTQGIEIFQINTGVSLMNILSGCVPSYRVTLTSNTTYYLVVNNIYTSTTCPTNARLSATRVG